MEKGAWKITLADGTELEGLRLNGNNFISDKPITAASFAGKLAQVKIEGPEDADDAGLRGEHEHMELNQIQQHGSEYWFILLDRSPAELKELKLRGDVEYLAMMAGIDLEEAM